MSGSMKEAMKKAQESAAAKDPFALPDLDSLAEQLEDVAGVEKRLAEEEAERAEREEKLQAFSQRLFPVMADLVSKREENRGRSQKNVSHLEAQIGNILSRKEPRVVELAKTAYVLACAHAKTGIQDAEVLFQDLGLENGAESFGRRLMKQDLKGGLSYRGKTLSFSFDPAEYSGQLYDALRQRFGEAQKEYAEIRQVRDQELLAEGTLSVFELFAGKKGKFAGWRPKEEITLKNSKVITYFAGIALVESDGENITVIGGSRGLEKILQKIHKLGLRLSVNALNNPNWWVSKEEFKSINGLHKILWSIRKDQEARGFGPETDVLRKKMKEEQSITPEKFFSGEGSPGKTLVEYDEKTEDGKLKTWRHWSSGQVGKGKYQPIDRVFALLERREDGSVVWARYPRHLAQIGFGQAVRDKVNLEATGRNRVVCGSATAFYGWAKKRFGPQASPVEAPETEAKPVKKKKPAK